MIERPVNVHFGGGTTTKVRLSQFDSGWTFVFAVYMDGERWTIPSTVTATMTGKKPDRNVFAYNGTVDTTNNVVRVNADVQMTACEGLTHCELVFLEAGKTVGTTNFLLVVEPAPKSPDDISSETTLPAYAEVLNAVEEDAESVRRAAASATAAAASAAEAQRILDSIPSDYSALQSQVNGLASDISDIGVSYDSTNKKIVITLPE